MQKLNSLKKKIKQMINKDSLKVMTFFLLQFLCLAIVSQGQSSDLGKGEEIKIKIRKKNDFAQDF